MATKKSIKKPLKSKPAAKSPAKKKAEKPAQMGRTERTYKQLDNLVNILEKAKVSGSILDNARKSRDGMKKKL